jgi:uncharacterized protein (DUF433 family)
MIEFALFSNEVHRELDPRGPLERLAVEQVALAAWSLKSGLEKRTVRDQTVKDVEPIVGDKPQRYRPSTLDRSSRSLKEALELLDTIRRRTSTRPEVGPSVEPIETELFSNEWPVVDDDPDRWVEDREVTTEPSPGWHDRLVFDFEVSDISPVVKGTWITVGHVVSEIVDGQTWADILRSHPELTEDDIRTCVAYAMAEENSPA